MVQHINVCYGYRMVWDGRAKATGLCWVREKDRSYVTLMSRWMTCALCTYLRPVSIWYRNSFTCSSVRNCGDPISLYRSVSTNSKTCMKKGKGERRGRGGIERSRRKVSASGSCGPFLCRRRRKLTSVGWLCGSFGHQVAFGGGEIHVIDAHVWRCHAAIVSDGTIPGTRRSYCL